MGTLTSWGPARWCSNALLSRSFALLVVVSACSSEVSNTINAGGATNASGVIAAAGSPDIEGDPPLVETFTWCDAQPIVVAKCGRCHADPPRNGAPFSLLAHADTQTVDKKGKPRYERMQTAIESDFMPALFLTLEPPVEPLSKTERQQLLDWLADGAPRGEADGCAGSP
jgi:hypothetical protein